MNMEEKKKIPRLIKWYLGFKPGPLRIDLNLTNKCNQKCVYCYLVCHQVRYKDELTTGKIISLIKEASKLGVYNWNLMGGEPMFDAEKALTVMEEIKKHRMFGNLTTNGTLFNQRIIEKTVLLGWDCINFSIDSADEKIHDSLKNKGSFKKAKKALKQFKETKHKLKKVKPTIVIHSVLTNKNYKKIRDLIRFAKENDANKLEFTYVMPFSKSTKKLLLNKKEIKELKRDIPKLVRFSKKIGLETNLEESLKSITTGQDKKANPIIKSDDNEGIIQTNCFNPWTSLMILPNGDVGPCCRFNKKVGNIRKSSLKDIWNGDKINDFRKKIENNQVSTCKICPSTEATKNKKIKEVLEKSVILKIANIVGGRRWTN